MVTKTIHHSVAKQGSGKYKPFRITMTISPYWNFKTGDRYYDSGMINGARVVTNPTFVNGKKHLIVKSIEV